MVLRVVAFSSVGANVDRISFARVDRMHDGSEQKGRSAVGVLHVLSHGVGRETQYQGLC